MRVIAAIGISVATLVMFGRGAQSADLAYPPPPAYSEPDPQFEFGTGWYLRGDASFGDEDQPRLTAAGFGTQNVADYAVGGGFGYKITEYFRADITGDYFRQIGYSGTFPDPTGTNSAQQTLNRYDGMVNGYFDLGTWYGLTPYVGAGVGFGVIGGGTGSVTAENENTTGVPTSTRNAGSTSTNLAWAVMAGVSYSVSQNALIDLGYRHIDLGRYGSTIGPYPFSRSFSMDEVRLGLRYMIF